MYTKTMVARSCCAVNMRKMIPLSPMRVGSYLLSFLVSALLLTACGGGGGSGSNPLPQPGNPTVPEPQISGYNAVFIGHSFFRPFAQGIGGLAIDAGFVEHTDTGVYAGGSNGAPQSLWLDTGPDNAAIKAALDQGDVDVFGMTYGSVDPDNIVNGYRQWIAYALENNPEIEVFIGLPWADFPAAWDERVVDERFDTFAEAYEEAFHIDHVHHVLIDTLRTEFPATNIYCIPYGPVALELKDLLDSGDLMDDLAFQGKSDALFTDAKGHPGDIIVQAGLLVWLNAIYGVDLSEHEYDTGYATDLHTLAADIMARHDSTYNREFGTQ